MGYNPRPRDGGTGERKDCSLRVKPETCHHLRPVTRLPESSSLTPARWWWQRRQFQSDKSRGRGTEDEREASCCIGRVSDEKCRV